MFPNLNKLGFGLGVQFFAGVLAVLIGFALTIYILVVFSDDLMPVPLVVDHYETTSPAEAKLGAPVCPGDHKTTFVYYHLSHQLIVEIFYNFMDAKHIFTYNEQVDGHAIAAHDLPGDYYQPIEWRVPEMPGGSYTFAIALWMRGVSAAPVYIYVPFTIRADCLGK